MSLFKKNHLKKLRTDLVKEFGGDIPDEDWSNIIEKVENDYRKQLKEVIPKAFWFAMFEVAERGECIVEIDGRNIGDEIHRLRNIYEWLKQRKLYFGW